MPPEERNHALLWDMRQAARDVAEFVRGISFSEFSTNKVVRYAVERQLMVIGEAANRVSSKLKQDHPGVPWDRIVAQRNVLAHEYGEILVERIWLVATERIPELIQMLEPLIPPPPEE